MTRSTEWAAPALSPIRVEAWQAALAVYPDRDFANLLVEGLANGFRIGYDDGCTPRSRSRRNMRSAAEHPDVVRRYIAAEVAAGTLRGPVQNQAGVHVSPFGVIPKSGPPGRWRLIVDLSSPRGGSVNDGISPEACSVSYVSVDEAVRVCWRMGKEVSLVKLDIQSAYRIVLVHPADRHLLGVAWQENVFVNTALPFGLRSAPIIFSAVADALLLILLQRGVQEGVHYLDDFLFFGTPNTAAGRSNREIALQTCEELGVPVALHKLEGPATCVSFLSLELDTQAQELRMPRDKLLRVQGLVRQWRARKKATKRELLSLVGLLHHAAKAIPAGRSFVRRLIDLSMRRPEMHHVLRLSAEVRADLLWWSLFLEHRNGSGFFASIAAKPTFRVQSDASGSWGCAAVTGSRWFNAPWSTVWRPERIALKELLPVVVAAAVWGREWSGSVMLLESDNSTVVVAVNSRTSRDATLMPLLRSLQFIKAAFSFTLRARHLPGKLKHVADALSREHSVTEVKRFCPQMAEESFPVPPALWELLEPRRINWLLQD